MGTQSIEIKNVEVKNVELKSIGAMNFSSIHICSLNEVDTFSSEKFNLSLKSIKSFADKSIISIGADKLYSIL